MAWLGLFALAAVLIFFIFLIGQDREDLAASTTALANEQALVLADHAARLLETSEMSLLTVVDDTAAMSWDEIGRSREVWSRIHLLVRRLPYLEAVWLNDADGRLRLSSLTFPAPSLDASERDYFLALRDGSRQVHLSHMVGGDRPTFRLSRRLETAPGQFRGVASMTIDSSFFTSFYASLKLPPGSSVLLLHQDDFKVLARFPPIGAVPPAAPQSASRLSEAIGRSADSGTFRAAAPKERGERITAYRRVPGFPMYVEVSIPLTSIEREWHRQIAFRAISLAAAMAAMATLTWMAFRQVHRQRAFQAELERRVAERTQELARAKDNAETLLQEVHHRVRNNLQIVGSLLAIQAAQTTDATVRAALEKITGRVHSMGLVHQQLYGAGRTADLAFGDYLRHLVPHLSELYGHGHATVRVEGSNPVLKLEVAVPLALILHEVLSNVLAHAFPHDREGSVIITLTDDGRTCRLVVEDDGVGLPDAFDWTRTRGLGLKIVRLLAAQIGGQARFSSQGGTRFELVFPLPP